MGWSRYMKGIFSFQNVKKADLKMMGSGTKSSSHVLLLQIKPLSAKLSVVPSPCEKKALDVLLDMMYRRCDVANPDIWHPATSPEPPLSVSLSAIQKLWTRYRLYTCCYPLPYSHPLKDQTKSNATNESHHTQNEDLKSRITGILDSHKPLNLQMPVIIWNP